MLPFSAYMVTALKTDDQGYIWFFISRAWNRGAAYDLSSPGTLEFYRKGHGCSLTIDGRVELVNNKAMMQEYMRQLLGKSIPVKEEALTAILLVKVKIEKFAYRELATQKIYNPLNNITFAIRNLWNITRQASRTQLRPAV